MLDFLFGKKQAGIKMPEGAFLNENVAPEFAGRTAQGAFGPSGFQLPEGAFLNENVAPEFAGRTAQGALPKSGVDVPAGTFSAPFELSFKQPPPQSGKPGGIDRMLAGSQVAQMAGMDAQNAALAIVPPPIDLSGPRGTYSPPRQPQRDYFLNPVKIGGRF